MNSKTKKNRRAFEVLGGFIVRRKYFLIIAWIVIFAVVIPIVIKAGNQTSLQQGSTSGNKLESVQADNIISAQFAKTVPNSSLLIVISATNISSPQTQSFIERLITQIKENSTVRGVQDITSVYSVLNPVLNHTDTATYQIYD